MVVVFTARVTARDALDGRIGVTMLAHVEADVCQSHLRRLLSEAASKNFNVSYIYRCMSECKC